MTKRKRCPWCGGVVNKVRNGVYTCAGCNYKLVFYDVQGVDSDDIWNKRRMCRTCTRGLIA